MLSSKCPLKVHISQGLGPFFQIELFKTDRMVPGVEPGDRLLDGEAADNRRGRRDQSRLGRTKKVGGG